MRKLAVNTFFCFGCLLSFGQPTTVKEISQANPPAKALAPLRFLASDELMGRGTLRPEIHVAARYISEQFKSWGLKQVNGTGDYFQVFGFNALYPASRGIVTINGQTFQMGADLLQMQGMDAAVEGPAIYLGYGDKQSWAQSNVKQKVVVVDLSKDSGLVRQELRALNERVKLASENGALALVLRYKQGDLTWERLQHNLQREHMLQDSSKSIPVLLVREHDTKQLAFSGEGKAAINISGNLIKPIVAKNVMGYIEGTDPQLKQQFIVLSSHYDHVGVAPQPKMEEGKLDSIYNGARDNAIGTTAVMDAADYFSKHPPKRSILFITYTGEEIGLVGSRYFAAHPTIPLKQVVYNLNIDNASYNDISRVTVVGLGRTSADDDIKKACAAYGLTAMPDPAPEQNLFDRSDNVSLAAQGIPAPTFSLGMKSFDETITNRYHQLSDEVGNMDLDYAMKFINSFILAAKNIADNPAQPQWKKGDKYEAAWQALYRKAF